MKRNFLILVLLVLQVLGGEEKDRLVGFYSGTLEGSKSYPFGGVTEGKGMKALTDEFVAEVHRIGDSYRIKFFEAPFKRATTYEQIDNVKGENGTIRLRDSGKWKLNGTITADKIDLTGKMTSKKSVDEIIIKMARYNYVSPTMGMKVPEGGVELFVGKDTSNLQSDEKGSPIRAKVIDGALEINTEKSGGKKERGDIISKVIIDRRCKVHLEFKLPIEYYKVGQSNGNSGIFFDTYEIQILNSFGGEGNFDDCGSLYTNAPPIVNACLPCGEWQTYDIEFSPARFEGGECIENPRVTVYQNGILVQKGTEIGHSTKLRGRKSKEKYRHLSGGLSHYLQDHSNPVQFRNWWIKFE